MGELLKSWLETEGPKLKEILMGPAMAAPQNATQHPSGVTTFPMMEPSDVPGETFEPAPSSLETMADVNSAPEGSETTFGDEPGATNAPGYQPTFGQAGPPAPAPAGDLGAEVPTEGKKGTSFDDVLKETPPEQIEAGIQAIEKANGGKSIEEIYTQATGNEGTQLSRQQKGELLMEFGLRLLAGSGPDGPGDAANFGSAGMATFGRYREMQQENRERPAKVAEKVQDFNLREAQIDKYLREPGGKSAAPQLKQDKDNNWVVIDPITGKAKTVVGEDGKPVAGKAGSEQRSLDFEVKRTTYEALFCDGLTGEAAAACKRKAFDAALTGNTDSKRIDDRRKQRVDIGKEVFKQLSDENNPMKYPTMGADGQVKRVRWKDLPDEDRSKILRENIDKTVEIMTGGAEGADYVGGAEGETDGGDGYDQPAVDLSQEDFDAIPEGKSARLDDGSIVKKQNGQLIRVK